MFICMAADTFAAQTPISPGKVFLGRYKLLFIDDIFGLVAFAASDSLVLSLEFIAGEPVIEFFEAIFPINQVIVAALMFHMARPAFAVGGIGMKPLACPVAFSQIFMAGKAVIRRKLLVGAMTFPAVFNAFELGMGFG
jgi:hypothetical protein